MRTGVHNKLKIKTKLPGHPNEIETQLVNEVTYSGYYFVVWPYASLLHMIPLLACHLHERIGSLHLYQIQSESYL